MVAYIVHIIQSIQHWTIHALFIVHVNYKFLVIHSSLQKNRQNSEDAFSQKPLTYLVDAAKRLGLSWYSNSSLLRLCYQEQETSLEVMAFVGSEPKSKIQNIIG